MKKKKKVRYIAKQKLGNKKLLRKNPFNMVRRTMKSPWFLGITDQVALSGGNFLTGLIVARGCSQAEFGLFSLGMTIVILMLDIQAGLVSTPQAIYSAGLEETELKVFTGSTLIHQLVLSVLCAGLLGAVAEVLFTFKIGVIGLSPVLGVIALFTVFILLREYWRRLFILKGWMWSVVIFDVGIVFIQVAAIIALIYYGKVSAVMAHAFIGIVCACFAAPLLLILRKYYAISMRSIWADFKTNLQVGGWLVINSVLWSIGNYAYPWLLAMMHGSKATGIWAACMSIISIVGVALGGILNVLTPNIARAHAEREFADFRRYIHNACINYVAFALALAYLPVFFGELLISMIYGSAYGDTNLIIGVLALNAIFGTVTGCFGRGLMVIGHAKWDFVFNVATLVFVFTFGWWSTSNYGVLGAAIGLTAANGIATLMRFIAFEWISQRLLLVAHPI